MAIWTIPLLSDSVANATAGQEMANLLPLLNVSIRSLSHPLITLASGFTHCSVYWLLAPCMAVLLPEDNCSSTRCLRFDLT